jgi:Na+/melibiose symporter-like transporter
MNRFGWDSFFVRFCFAAFVVFATYNAEGFSYFHWVKNNLGDLNLYMALVAVVLTIGWAILIRATTASLGMIGLALATAFFGLLAWLVIDVFALDARSAGAITYIIELMIASVLSVGVSWSHLRRSIAGQVDTDELDHEL